MITIIDKRLADVQVQAANNETTETGTMSNVQVINNSNEVSEFKDEWDEGSCGEWIYGYNRRLELLLMTHAHDDFENIFNRLVHDEGSIFTTEAEMIVSSVESDEVENAVMQIASKDRIYTSVLDWSNKENVAHHLNNAL